MVGFVNTHRLARWDWFEPISARVATARRADRSAGRGGASSGVVDGGSPLGVRRVRPVLVQLVTRTLAFTASFLVESWAEAALTSQDFVVPTVAPSFTLRTSRKTFDVPGATFFRT